MRPVNLFPARPAALSPGKLSLIAVGIVLLALSARIQVPFWPVPMTLQTLTVMAFGVTLGGRMATGIVAGYLAAGLAGLPVFAGSAFGLAALTGPTGGFLAGMLALAWISGLARGQNTLLRALSLLAGTVALYAAGLTWLSAWLPADKLLAQGLLPFIAGDSVKIALIILLPMTTERLRKTR